MNPGKMRYRVSIKEPVKVDDGMGGRRYQGFALVAQVWADVRSPRIREQIAIGTPVTELTGEVVIRRGDFLPKRGWRVEEGQHVYEVVAVKPYDLETSCLLVQEIES